jgi:hypothetical protein
MDRSKIGRRLLVSVTAALGWLTVCSAEAQESESQFTLQCKAEVTEGTATTPVGRTKTTVMTFDLEQRRYFEDKDWDDIAKVNSDSICPYMFSGRGISITECISRSTGSYSYRAVTSTGSVTWEGTCIKVAYQGAPANKF